MRFDYLILLSCKLYLNASPVLMWFLGGDHEVRKACMGIGQQCIRVSWKKNHKTTICNMHNFSAAAAAACPCLFFTILLHGCCGLNGKVIILYLMKKTIYLNQHEDPSKTPSAFCPNIFVMRHPVFFCWLFPVCRYWTIKYWKTEQQNKHCSVC